MTEEKWRPIPDHPGYEASDQGRIHSARKVLSQRIAPNGYPTTMVGRGSPQLVHRLVAAAFLGPCPEGQEVRHLNGDRTDPRLVNLTYGTRSENRRDKIRHGRDHQVNKTHCPKGHPYDEENTYIDGGARKCKICNRARARANYRANKSALLTT